MPSPLFLLRLRCISLALVMCMVGLFSPLALRLSWAFLSYARLQIGATGKPLTRPLSPSALGEATWGLFLCTTRWRQVGRLRFRLVCARLVHWVLDESSARCLETCHWSIPGGGKLADAWFGYAVLLWRLQMRPVLLQPRAEPLPCELAPTSHLAC